MRALYSRVCALTLVAGALSFLGCVVLPRREPGLTMTSHRVPQPKPESCPATITGSGAAERGVKPFASSDDLRRHTGTTVWFAADGRLGDWGKEHKYHFGEPVVLCADEPFENEGRVASKEVLDAQNVLVKTADGAFFNAPIAALSMAPPRFDKSQVSEGPATAENACAMFLEYLDAKTELAAQSRVAWLCSVRSHEARLLGEDRLQVSRIGAQRDERVQSRHREARRPRSIQSARAAHCLFPRQA